MSLKFLSLALVAVVCASPFESLSKASGDEPCEPCQPQGATGTTPPAVGTDLSSLYLDVLTSVKDINFKKRSVEPRAEGFCCRQSLNCVNVQNLNIPMCYDKFTTNFAFPDGSFGSLTTGDYSSGGASANLLTGNYTNGDKQGNIYANDEQAKPNTATLSIPPQYTGTGVGSAVPASELGSVIVYTTTIPGTTFTAPTTVPETVMVATVSGQAVSTTVPATTVTQPTTIAPQTNVVTKTQDAAATSSSTGAAGQVAVDSTSSLGMSILGALMYALYAL
ncbi:Nn.00g111350.m01.CDS01 [Neocucurbitaria sp. VM-36]